MYITTRSLREHCDPIKTPPWDTYLSQTDVARAIAAKDFVTTPVTPDASAAQHCQRIAYLYHHGWDDPICVDVGVPWMPGHIDKWLIEDGNHRFYAALMRKDITILVEPSGCLDTFETMFEVAHP